MHVFPSPGLSCSSKTLHNSTTSASHAFHRVHPFGIRRPLHRFIARPSQLPSGADRGVHNQDREPQAASDDITDSGAISLPVSVLPDGLEAASAEAQNHADITEEPKGFAWMPQVPWDAWKIAQVMALWLLAYIIIGQVAVPITLLVMGLERDELTIRGHAILHLCLDLSQLGVTLMILWSCLKEFKPRRLGLFPIKWKGVWPALVLLCCLVFPGVDWIAQQSMSWFPLEADQWANQVEHSLSIGDWITNISYFSVVSICAPIWEEAIFRGFLMASLARYMPVGAAVLSSSLLFAMCHFRTQTFLPLLALGVVFSSIFLFTRNLLPPIVLHSLWNVYVMFNLLFKPA